MYHDYDTTAFTQYVCGGTAFSYTLLPTISGQVVDDEFVAAIPAGTAEPDFAGKLIFLFIFGVNLGIVLKQG